MKSLKLLAASAFLLAGTAQAAPVLYEFSGTYGFEVRGSLGSGFTDVTPTQNLYSSGVTISGSFTYDNTVGVSDFGGTGVSIGSVTNFTTNLDGGTIFDPLGATLMQNNTGTAGQDFVGILADPEVGVPLPHELSGFDIADGEGTLFQTYNVRFNWQQLLTLIPSPVLSSDFVDNYLVNPAVLPPPGHDGGLNIAVDFLQVDNGILNEGVQHIVFFNDVVVNQVPEPSTLILMGLGLAGLGFRRKVSVS